MANQFMNVREPWELHDTLCICANRYGSEIAAGYFATFGAFAANERHLFFKNRSIGNVHLAYNNQAAVDRSDFVFHAFSLGVHFFGPCTPALYQVSDLEVPQLESLIPEPYQSWWIHTLPRHIGIEFSVGQDVKLSAQALMAAPGYGPDISGLAGGIDGGATEIPEIIWSGTQGVPEKRCRFQFGDARNPSPIAIPRGELIEVKLTLSQYAQRVISQFTGPGNYVLQQLSGEIQDWKAFPARFGIQVSLYGMREVQQRGQLHV